MMSLFPLPASVEKRLEVLRKQFLCQGNKDKKGIHLVKWKTLTISKQGGGLGVRNLRRQNKSLLMKWLWRFSKEEQALWSKVIREKYEKEEFWMTKGVHTPYGVCLWRSIRNLWPNLKDKLSLIVKDEKKALFWEDNWLGIGSLKQLYPNIYTLNQQHGVTMKELWSTQGWNLTFRRFLQDWEVPRMIEFYRTLEQCSGLQEGEDTLRWQKHSNGMYSVSSAYKDLNREGSQLSLWPWKHIWKVKVPYKVACFTWLVIRESVLTRDNLRKRGIPIVSRCYLCGNDAETISHLFLYCRVTSQLWDLFINLRGARWVMPGRTSELLLCWNTEIEFTTDKNRWKIVPATIWWTIWKERNLRCFEDTTNSLQKIKMKCILLFCFWCKSEYVEDPDSILDVLSSL